MWQKELGSKLLSESETFRAKSIKTEKGYFVRYHWVPQGV